MEDFIHIGQTQRKAHFPPIHTDKKNKIWIGNCLKILSSMKQIVQGNRIVSPVAVETLIVETVDDLHLCFNLLQINRTQDDLAPFLNTVDDFLYPLRHPVMERHIPRIKSADTLQTCRLGKPCIVGGIPRH